MSKQYDRDFYGWANEQAALLRAGQLSAADIENIAEEIESMGRGEKRELVNRLIVLLQHLLKWEFQPEGRSNSWRATILEQRDRIMSHLADNPSLRARLPNAMEEAYRVARIRAGGETNLGAKIFPAQCPYQYDIAISDAFWPGSA